MRSRLATRLKAVLYVFTAVLFAGVSTVGPVYAADPVGDFSLQVSPSPLVATIKPGTTTTLDLKVRNGGTEAEELKIESRKFSVNSQTGQVTLDDTAPSEIAQWISFSAPTFSVQPGEWYTQKIRIALPKDTGFSYSLALIISRTKNVQPTESGRLIKGSVAVFTLINVDRPGATRKLEVESLSTTANVYEYLPATISVRFKNAGNTIIQPYGNIFIQRSSSDATPITTLPVNDKKGYILPGSDRVLTADWSDGFPVYQVTTAADGSQQKSEKWDWPQLSKFRVGPYTAKLVAVYNDGQRDVAIEKETSFWVVPWKIILGALVVLILVVLGVWTLVRKIWSFIRRGGRRAKKEQ